MNEDKLEKVAEGLEGASKKHAKQAKTIRDMLGESGPFKMGSYPMHYGTSPMTKKNAEGKEQGVDGKACWDGYKYAGTENGKDKCVPI